MTYRNAYLRGGSDITDSLQLPCQRSKSITINELTNQPIADTEIKRPKTYTCCANSGEIDCAQSIDSARSTSTTPQDFYGFARTTFIGRTLISYRR